MMFSTRAEYGVRVMTHLADRADGEPVALGKIAETEGLPLAYLEQLVQRLRRANLVTSRRGARGGYALARAADTITMAEVVRALEGRIAPIECITSGIDADGEPVCSREAMTERACPTKLLWTRVQGAIVGTLEDIPLSDLTRPGPTHDPKPQRKLTPA
jgi:Rrf2 family transcriptional regulator, cysteine metabolism repressor